MLDDDDDMAEMYLTDKLQEQLDDSTISSVDEQDELDGPDMEGSENSDAVRQHIDSRDEQIFGRGSHTHTSMHSAMTKHLDVEELEMLLEAYFVQIDGTLNKLSTVRNSFFYIFHFLDIFSAF